MIDIWNNLKKINESTRNGNPANGTTDENPKGILDSRSLPDDSFTGYGIQSSLIKT